MFSNGGSSSKMVPGAARQSSSSSMKRQASGSWSSSGTSGKLEKKSSIIRRESKENGINGIRINNQNDSRDDAISDLRSDMEKLKSTCTCLICQELLFEPFFFHCGHVYCYICIVQWIGQARNRKSRFCPQCRETIKSKPSPAYLIREMIEIFIQRAELNGSGSELRKQQQDAVKLIKMDTSPKGQGLFKGLFDKEVSLYGVVDREDEGILRCPRCMWEVHGRRCQNPDCSVRVREIRDDFSDESDTGSETEGEGGIEPPRWPESVMGEETGEDMDRFDDEFDDDEWEDEEEQPGVRLPGAPIIIDDIDDDDEPISNRARRNNRALISETDGDEEDSDDTEGSLVDFVVADSSPQVSRRDGANRRPNRTGPPWALAGSSPAPEPLAPPRRSNARPIIVDNDDEDEDEDVSSLSEASSAPGHYSGGPRRGFRHDHRSHISISSDYDDDEQSLLSNGYQALGGNQTASENEDDGSVTPPPRLQHRRNFAGSSNTPGSVFSVPEEGDEESGDADDSEDADGDVRMSESDQQNPRQSNRRTVAGSSRVQHPIDLDSASESEVALSTRRRQRRAPVQSTTSRTNYFSSHQRNTSGSSRTNQRNNRSNTSIDPRIQNLFASHHQLMAERRYDVLGARPLSVSPARSLTPVQRDITGARRNAGSRTGSRSIDSRDTTPVQQQSIESTPPPFSPLQQTPESEPRSRQGTVEGTPSPGQIAPGSPASSYHSVQSSLSRIASLSPRAGGAGPGAWGLPPHVQPQVQRIASPGFGIRVRSRTSRSSLRGSSSRTGLRNGAQSPHVSSFAGGTGIAGTQGRHTPQQQQPQFHQPPQQQARSPSGMPARPRYLTSDDVRARGQYLLQQRRAAGTGNPAQLVGARSSSMEPSLATNSNGVNTGNLTAPNGRGRGIGALVGGGPDNETGSGPTLVIGHEES